LKNLYQARKVSGLSLIYNMIHVLSIVCLVFACGTYYITVVIVIILKSSSVIDHKNSLTPPLFIEEPVPSQKSERSFIFVIEYRLCLCFHDIWILFWTGWIFCLFSIKKLLGYCFTQRLIWVAGLSYFYGPKLLRFVKWCCRGNVFRRMLILTYN
jgi:hypothetical protein